MKRIGWILLALLLLLPVGASAESEEGEEPEEMRMVLHQLDLREWDRWFIAQDPAIPFVPSDFLTAALQNDPLPKIPAPEKLLPSLLGSAAKPLLTELFTLVGFGVLCAVLSALSPGFGGIVPEGVLRLLGGGLVLAFCVPILQNTASLLSLLANTAESLLPLLGAFFAVFGLTGGDAIETGISVLSGGMLRLCRDVLFPLALIGCVLTALDGFGQDRLAPIGALCHRAARWILRMATAFYGTVTAVRGVAKAHTDSLLLRTARIAAGALPEIGRLTADTADVFAACVLSVRSLLGITAALMLLAVLLRPVAALLMQVFALRLASAILSPFGQNGYVSLLRTAASMMGIALSALAAAILLLLVLLSTAMGVLGG